jgi:hypothetical protein
MDIRPAFNKSNWPKKEKARCKAIERSQSYMNKTLAMRSEIVRSGWLPTSYDLDDLITQANAIEKLNALANSLRQSPRP